MLFYWRKPLLLICGQIRRSVTSSTGAWALGLSLAKSSIKVPAIVVVCLQQCVQFWKLPEELSVILLRTVVIVSTETLPFSRFGIEHILTG